MNPESLFTLISSFPVIALSLVGFAVIVSTLKQLIWKEKHPQKQRRRIRFSTRRAAIGLAMLPFSAIYKPNLIEVVKAQIHQNEDADEDDNGDPDTPKKHLLRQLRRIRRGEKIDILSLRLK